MNNRKWIMGIILVSGLAVMAGAEQADSKTSAVEVDNTAVNGSNGNAALPTADQAKTGTSDEQITREIRKSIVSDKDLSVYAHNVKIIAQGGKVTLKGPVHSEAEKATVGAKASAVAGEQNVINDVTVKGS